MTDSAMVEAHAWYVKEASVLSYSVPSGSDYLQVQLTISGAGKIDRNHNTGCFKDLESD